MMRSAALIVLVLTLASCASQDHVRQTPVPPPPPKTSLR